MPRVSEISSKSNFAGAVTRLVTNHLIALQNYNRQIGVQGAWKVPIGKTAVGSMNRKYVKFVLLRTFDFSAISTYNSSLPSIFGTNALI